MILNEEQNNDLFTYLEKRVEEGGYNDPVTMTSPCPKCGKEWERKVALQAFLQIPVVLAMAYCENCSPGENITLIGNNKVWKTREYNALGDREQNNQD